MACPPTLLPIHLSYIPVILLWGVYYIVLIVQLIIDDVHFRYEDSTVDLSHPVAIGVTIKKLAVQSADEKWLPNFVTGASMMRKLVELEQVAVYWDVDAALVGDVPVMQLKVSV